MIPKSFLDQFLSRTFNHPATQMFLGAVVSAATTVTLDWQKRPKLKIEIDNSAHWGSTKDPQGLVIENFEFVRVAVSNQKRPPKGWPRQTLSRATADITFHDPNTGANLCGPSMKGRWVSLLQPEIAVVEGRKSRFVGDRSLIRIVPEIDIPWGVTELLDIAVRFEKTDPAYGWSNDNYYDPKGRYRAEKWRLEQPRCLVKVTIEGAGEKWTKIFRLTNERPHPLKLENSTRWEAKLVMKVEDGG